MIILTAGHTGPNSGAQCATTQFDEGAENIWLRNRIAEILTNDYGLVVLVDEDKATLQLVKKRIELEAPHIDLVIDLHFNAHPTLTHEARRLSLPTMPQNSNYASPRA